MSCCANVFHLINMLKDNRGVYSVWDILPSLENWMEETAMLVPPNDPTPDILLCAVLFMTAAELSHGTCSGQWYISMHQASGGTLSAAHLQHSLLEARRMVWGQEFEVRGCAIKKFGLNCWMMGGTSGRQSTQLNAAKWMILASPQREEILPNRAQNHEK